jgi:hypothetical protein
MAIQELINVVPPPLKPGETGSLAAWNSIQEQLGITLPDDYRDFAMTYGSGTFNDPGRLCVPIMNPFAPAYAQALSFECDTLLLIGGPDWPHRAFPQRPGLFPWGTDDNGCTLLWLTSGPPAQWPILLNPPRSIDLERVDLAMTTFLAKAFSKELQCTIWSAPEFFSGPRRVKFATHESEIEYQ